MIRTPRPAAIAACVFVLAATFAAAQQSASHTAALSSLSLDRLADGSVVATMISGGDDLGGVVTFNLRPDGNGTYAGEWALTVSHADNTDPDTGEEPEHEEGIDPETGQPHQHLDYLRLVNRGSLDGSVVAAHLTFDSEGALSELTAPLTIRQGSKEFAGATGSGEATIDALTLTF